MCSTDIWKAPEGATGEEASIVIDMKCSIEFQKVEMINGIGDFITKGFSIFGSNNSKGPWRKLYMGEFDLSSSEVRKFSSLI